ncbi:MAG: hypothetical protein LBJ15_09935 [Comamonas sp.]|jgi:hypothetical protein|uniref:hypothetical protein n=1 Tax=Comamonas sp. TaxID=34028 RepID=UPI002837D4B8|nr:hypothetical protein [Comamonas sp.]MDR0214309.1 hypothetical protein [Comamonas sp.]
MKHQTAQFEVELALLPVALGRKSAAGSGYRPNHKHPLTGEYFMGQFSMDASVAPGEQARVSVTVLASAQQIDQLQSWGSWTIWEGSHPVGSVKLLQAS